MTIKKFVEQNCDKDIPVQEVKILTGIKPKYKCKNKLLQNLLIKAFCYITTYETRQAKVIISKAEDYYGNFDGNFTIEVGE